MTRRRGEEAWDLWAELIQADAETYILGSKGGHLPEYTVVVRGRFGNDEPDPRIREILEDTTDRIDEVLAE